MNIAPGEIGAAAAPLNRARSMPAGFYTDPEIFRREREMIFLKHWFFLCRDDQLPAAGDYRSFDTPGGPIVLLRGRRRCSCAALPIIAAIAAPFSSRAGAIPVAGSFALIMHGAISQTEAFMAVPT